ncbi:transglutaminase domain-containing protein [Lysinibacillus sp. BW-2-10]|uniref:transglutaminase TgpA family protein n=1 Tax=Lysinibacillus sp. BW-2-10 TaxID=2590030 RepID=UPI001180D43B|nr:transglutaminase domain-containing protein [Lysinibacillus sp. BW-2-10]TSI04472.1 transglutaminase [Lysinibacillus sp. BW-2-10]
MKKNTFNLVELGLYYVLIFFILREWLVPVMELTGTGYLELILFFIALALALSLFRVHFAIAFLIKFFYISWFIVHVYSKQSVFTPAGIQFLLSEFQYNIGITLRADWVQVTDAFRTFLFLILIWMLIYLIHHWITVRMTIFYFLVLTVFFIGTLDTFTEYDGTYAIIKIILLGLVMTAFLFLKRLFTQAGVELNWMKYIKLVFPVILLIGLTSIVAIYLPKSAPQWPDPVPFLKAATGQGGEGELSNGVGKVGYGDNDSRLGGAFVADDTVVLLAESETKQYWRIETKDVYTSKGWENSTYYSGSSTVYGPGDLIQHSLPSGPEEDTKLATIHMLYPYEFIVQPYGLKSISQTSEAMQFFMNDNSEKIVPVMNNNTIQLNNYSLEYSKPVYLYSDLKSSNLENLDPYLVDRYLQLPETLPNRVVELAQDVVAGKESVYDQARAIEMYFRQNGFRYDTDDVAIPSEEQDYADQFLFETKVGYCDNFSTSMVVMLRSVGIPARWVKGFAGGELIRTNGDMKNFEVTNNDAHSWVEAFIPNVGWINFEPTIGFNNSRSIDYDFETDDEREEELSVDEETEPDEVVKEQEETKKQNTSQNNLFTAIFNSIKQHKWIYIISLLILVGGAAIVYVKRKSWLPKVYLKMSKRKQYGEPSFELMYMQLLKVLEMKGLKRKEGQTLITFAKEVDAYYETNHMSKITVAYEQYLYGGRSTKIDMNQMKESWEYLINRTTS